VLGGFINDEYYFVTPKAYLAILANIDDFDGMDKLWNEFISFVLERAKHDGYIEGIPCLVLEGGGRCITVSKHEA
jgi:hypothetical protein